VTKDEILPTLLGQADDRAPLILRRNLHQIASFEYFDLTGYSSLFYRRTPAAYILRWESTYPARAALAALQQDGPGALPVYRQLVLAGNAWTTEQAAARLGEMGVPAIDVPLLLRARQRLWGAQGAADAVQQVEAALRRLGGTLERDGE
jgi:hypothetical protein